MRTSELETVLVVCADPERCADIIARLHDEGVSVVGTAHTASLALALAAQTAPRTAILAGQTAGRRGAEELARELSDTWGVECLVLRRDGEEKEADGFAAEIRTADLEALRSARLQ